MKLKTGFLILSLGFCMSRFVQAEDEFEPAFYEKINITLYGGLAIPGTDLITMNNSFTPGLGLLFKATDKLSLESSFTYSNFNFSNNALLSLRRLMFTGEVKYKLFSISRFDVLTGGGLSYVSDKNEYNVSYQFPSTAPSQNDFTAHGLLGLDVGLTDNVVVGFRGRYHTFITTRNQSYTYQNIYNPSLSGQVTNNKYLIDLLASVTFNFF